jgi:hypothetical protein
MAIKIDRLFDPEKLRASWGAPSTSLGVSGAEGEVEGGVEASAPALPAMAILADLKVELERDCGERYPAVEALLGRLAELIEAEAAAVEAKARAKARKDLGASLDAIEDVLEALEIARALELAS